METTILKEIFKKTVILTKSISEIKKSLPDGLRKNCTIHNHPTQYFSYSVLDDIEGMLKCILRVFSTLDTKEIGDEIRIFDYVTKCEFDLWQRKIIEHLMMVYFFEKENNRHEFHLYLCYSKLELCNSTIIDSMNLFQIPSDMYELYDGNSRRKIISNIIFIQKEIHEKKVWFLEKKINLDKPYFIYKNKKYLKSINSLYRDIRNNIAIPYRVRNLFSIYDYYGKLSNNIHANPIFYREVFIPNNQARQINNNALSCLIETLSRLFIINTGICPKSLEDIRIKEEDAEMEYKNTHCKEFYVGEKVYNWLIEKDCTIVKKEVNINLSINYYVDVDGKIINTPSTFLLNENSNHVHFMY